MATPEPVPAPSAVPTPPRAPATTGTTVGVEEEFHLVDADTFALRGDAELAQAALRGEAGERVHAEISTCELEAATAVCGSLAELRDELHRSRAEAT